MAKEIFSVVGRNYQVPGLPYEETFHFVKPVVFDDVPSKEEIVKVLAEGDNDVLVNPWSVHVLRGFRRYIPTTFRRVTQDMPPEMIQEYFPDDGVKLLESQRVLLQLQTEIDAKSATIDAAIINSRRDLGTVVNKAHLANRVYMIGQLFGHLKAREYPLLFGDIEKPENWDTALSNIKMLFVDYLQELPVGKRKYPRRIRKVDVSKKELQNKYGCAEWIKEKLGDDLIGILNYGSASRTDNPDKYSDFDNWVRVRDIRKAHKILQGTNPYLYEGKVVEAGLNKMPEEAKHIGIHLMPESEEYLIRHIRFLHDSREFLKHTKVLYGEFPFLKVQQDEVIERGISQAYIKLKTIAGSLNWAYSTPEKLIGKPALFEFIVKNVRFFLQHSLNALDKPVFRDKQELNELLKEKGMAIPEYKEDLQHIKDSILTSMVNSLHLQKELINSRRRPKLDFLLDDKTYEWNSPEIDDWSKYD